jgi:hypothetical protein
VLLGLRERPVPRGWVGLRAATVRRVGQCLGHDQLAGPSQLLDERRVHLQPGGLLGIGEPLPRRTRRGIAVDHDQVLHCAPPGCIGLTRTVEAGYPVLDIP